MPMANDMTIGQLPAERAAESDNKVLFKEILTKPRQIGAICPSSRRLANRMAAFIDMASDGVVVELGAGTGVVTEAILQRGVPADRLVVIEKSASLARLLARRFPGVCILHADAADIPALISQPGSVGAVISSLPLRSLPRDQVGRIAAAWAHSLSATGRIIQFTYAPFRASAWLDAGLQRSAHGTEWGNMPPALVEVFSRAP